MNLRKCKQCDWLTVNDTYSLCHACWGELELYEVLPDRVAEQRNVQADGVCTCYKPLLSTGNVTSTTCMRCGKPPRR